MLQKKDLTKEYIYKLKNDSSLLEKLMFENRENTKIILFILKYIGKLPQNFEGACFCYFLNHFNENVRYLAVKNIGKLQSLKYLSHLQQIAKENESSIVRCEVVSAIGRIRNEKDIDLKLQIKFNGVCIDLNINESLIIINTLAVKRATFRGCFWSSVGKNVEKYLMLTLCKLYQVPENYYDKTHFVKNKKAKVDRKVDFFLVNGEKRYRCEVKLMGAGNQESADAIIAKDSDLFIADTLSTQNKNQCEKLGVCWVTCRDKEGYQRFKLALDKFKIPYVDYNGNLDNDLHTILACMLE